MARPTSEEKRKAILDAAERLVAETGTGVSTAKIARAAGVAEGTVFVYFETKSMLMNALLGTLEAELAAAFSVGSRPGDGGRGDIRHVWDRLIAWGSAHPAKWRALKRLKVSEYITEASRREMDALFGELIAMLAETIRRHAGDAIAPDYAGVVLNALAEVTFERIAAEPDRSRHYTDLGFNFFWNGITAGKSG
ncbi:TetR/AcrR family transcriptional regulator [Martelella soudanensis]|uniref:TetR/AcrR family transcriptional regulator n=1 Tax=unclassified Martelella TaxID=2629616 RepID=UPI0015DEB3AC|nr:MULTISPECIES: TetR/AcrR family transcriptional regulator [unclassified Martelella]